ncbi:hypothetical protein ASPTUDRAFT_550320 [Aspergillus tubingensis CBS 134.48]|uniref:Uncharacterized protein n=1 Tax=Aspergillus tubingensis (strain CBS 134.48) TaxID=767770 RepID=A0A1L9N6R4_ASPTC|nr:hypothetical protein ASPTUDRAFT_550320 [Aspergillus tubingensis CBS 134.48]
MQNCLCISSDIITRIHRSEWLRPLSPICSIIFLWWLVWRLQRAGSLHSSYGWPCTKREGRRETKSEFKEGT